MNTPIRVVEWRHRASAVLKHGSARHDISAPVKILDFSILRYVHVYEPFPNFVQYLHEFNPENVDIIATKLQCCILGGKLWSDERESGLSINRQRLESPAAGRHRYISNFRQPIANKKLLKYQYRRQITLNWSQLVPNVSWLAVKLAFYIFLKFWARQISV